MKKLKNSTDAFCKYAPTIELCPRATSLNLCRTDAQVFSFINSQY